MDNMTIYIILSLIAAVFFVVHIWEELTCTLAEELHEAEAAYERKEITLKEYEGAIDEIVKKSTKSA